MRKEHDERRCQYEDYHGCCYGGACHYKGMNSSVMPGDHIWTCTLSPFFDVRTHTRNLHLSPRKPSDAM